MFQECGFKGCTNLVGPDGAKIGYKIKEKVRELEACGYHTHLVRVSPRGTWEITEDQELKPIPAKPLFFT